MSPDWSSSPEAVPYASLANPQSMNLYAYVGNDPIDGVDPDGHFVYTNQDGFTNSFADLGAWDALAVMNKDAVQPTSKSVSDSYDRKCDCYKVRDKSLSPTQIMDDWFSNLAGHYIGRGEFTFWIMEIELHSLIKCFTMGTLH